MIPVYQDKFYPDGNCFSACIASLLELPLRDVPHFTESDWFNQWEDWLESKGVMIGYELHKHADKALKGYAILGARSLRGDWNHAVVTFDGQIIHDPYPGGNGQVGEYRDWCFLRPIDA